MNPEPFARAEHPKAVGSARPKPTDLESFGRVIDRALEAGGAILRRRFGRVRARYKGRANPLTQADLESQKAVLGIIHRAFPSHDWLAEEKSRRQSGSDFLWIVDPLDGTVNYAHGYPVSSVSIAVLHRGRLLAAGVHDPFRQESFTAQAGRGARLNGRPMRVSKVRRLAQSLVVTGFPYDRAQKAAFYAGVVRKFLPRCHDIRRSGSAALDMAWIAAGRSDGYWEWSLGPWDVAAGILLVREAGGKATDFSGRALEEPSQFGPQTMASNGLIHGQMLKLLRSRARG
ncbi:MAG: inositol monophosphatase [Elusimicrobia bacterium]|nr:inositol monophosphatase [Elusimicrobiota bacterium]